MVRQFKGIVKVADVQEEFDNLVNGINSMIQTYNDSAYVKDINYNDVSEELAPLNYTLSVGGLRKVLDTYDGCVVGCKVFQLNGYVAITNGLYITAKGGIKLPAAKIDLVGDYLFYSPSLKQYKTDDGYRYSYTTWEQPTFTSNETWGTISQSGFSNSTDGRTYPISILNQPFNIFETNPEGGFLMLSGVPNNVPFRDLTASVKWVFRQNLKITNINISFPLLNTGSQPVTVNIKKLDGTSLTSSTTVMGGSVDITLNGESLDGIIIEATCSSVIFAINQTTITAEAENKEPVNGNAGDATDWIAICKINNNRSLALSNTQDFTVGEIDGLKIGTQSKNVQWRTPESLTNEDNAQFVSGVEGDQKERTGRATTYLCGEEVAWNEQTGHRNSSCWTVYNKLLVPKKVPNPYTYAGGARTNMTKVFNVVEKRE